MFSRWVFVATAHHRTPTNQAQAQPTQPNPTQPNPISISCPTSGAGLKPRTLVKLEFHFCQGGQRPTSTSQLGGVTVGDVNGWGFSWLFLRGTPSKNWGTEACWVSSWSPMSLFLAQMGCQKMAFFLEHLLG